MDHLVTKAEATFAVEQSLVFSLYWMRPHSAFNVLHLIAHSMISPALKVATGLVRPAQASALKKYKTFLRKSITLDVIDLRQVLTNY